MFPLVLKAVCRPHAADSATNTDFRAVGGTVEDFLPPVVREVDGGFLLVRFTSETRIEGETTDDE